MLLDTHTFLWFISDDPRLSSAARDAIEEPSNRRFLSVASLWEMAIKVSLGKLALAQPIDVLLPRQLEINGVELLPIEAGHALRVATLPFHHRDPFDRLLVAQCLEEDLPLISADQQFDAYGIRRIW